MRFIFRKRRNAALAAERQRCLAAVDVEPELPGDIPPDLYQALMASPNILTETMRLVVKHTKANIRERMLDLDTTSQPARLRRTQQSPITQGNKTWPEA